MLDERQSMKAVVFRRFDRPIDVPALHSTTIRFVFPFVNFEQAFAIGMHSLDPHPKSY